MADLIKVKPKKDYQWNQDPKFVYVRIPITSQISLKKVEIFLSDLILRITSLQKKSTHFLDLYKQIDYKSSQNKFTLTDGQIHVILKKTIHNQIWQKLLIDNISLSDLKIRRRQSQARYQQNIKQVQQNKSKLKIDYDRKATQQLMRFQQEQRLILDNKKKQEKQQAIKEIFSGVNENTGKIQTFNHQSKENQSNIYNQSHTVQYQEKKWREKQQLALKLIQQEEQKQKKELKNQRKKQNQQKIVQKVQRQIGNTIQRASTATSRSIFTQEDVQSYNKMRQDVGQLQYEQIPVRKSNNVTVKFSERIFPHLAARDTHVKQPPMPKNNASKSTVNGDLQTKNPLWLKDKGDQFFKDNNYISAIQAYTQAINIDNKMLAAYANRSLCHLKQFNFINVINDCQQSLNLIKAQISSSQQDNIKSFNFIIKIQIRRAMALGWKGELKNAKNQLNQIISNNQQRLNPQIKQQINKSIYLITQRQQSISYKIKGDQQVKLCDYQRAIVNYDQSIGVDKNQYSISNKALCLNKIKSFNKSVQVINQGIQKINWFNLNVNNTKNIKEYQKLADNKKPLTILLKLYFRKAKALEQLDKIKQAEETLHKGLAIDSSDKDFQLLLKQINIKKNKLTIKEQKQKAAVCIKQGKHEQGLKIYQKCLKLIESNDDLQQYLSLLQNQCVCYLKLNDYESIISTAIRIMKIINNAQSRIVDFGDKKTINLTVEQMNKISVRTLMRRANAYLKKGQVYNAKGDLQKALQISPRDQVILKQLQKIKQQLGMSI